MRPCRTIVTLWLLACALPAVAVPLVFRADGPASRGLARQFQTVWNEHGQGLVDALVPAGTPLDTVQCVILPTDAFQRYFGDRLPDWGVGAAVPSGRLIAVDHQRLPVVGPGAETLFLHEMTHALLFQAAGEARLPTWLHEGAAMRASGEWRFRDTVAVALSGRVPTLQRLDGPFPRGGAGADMAYRTSLAAVLFLDREHGPGAIPRVVAAAREAGDFRRGFQAATGETADAFARRFAASMRLRYGWVLLLFRWPTLFVIVALVFLVGAARKLIIARRALREPDEDEPFPS